ncbi:GH20683 [Drosophila grimshawi]|uniref:FXNA-like protease n=1 Tax=Drosophila grimshawi TaxID=7222 RepID=B4J734_DROGR|nr:GH20683 [Drosophila grimshawi]
MCDKEKLICNESGRSFVETPRYVDKTEAKLPWYFATGFLLFWGLLFFAVVIPFFNRLPTAKTMEDSKDNVFIAERAYKNLYTLSNIGTKMIGSTENEIETVQYLLKELNQIKTDSLKEYFDIEIDVSQVSGQFLYQNTNNMYQGVQNVAAKLTSKNSKSNSYLLINSHFDSKPETPSAGDDCFMVATMLEILRVMATTEQTFENPIVFLFNGAEESSMLASHGFVNQHKWAPNLKAVINLDAAGSGGREILFQSGPKNSWLVDYYNSHVKHPFGHTLGEEIYQTGMLPSDSDYTQFKTHMPGLDIGQCVNGFIYHTKYDKIDVIPQESVQNTGENLLGLVRGLSNATELHNSEMHNKGNAIYFDFLGIYFIHYSETTGIYLNYSVAGATIILIFLSMSRTAAVSNISTCHVMRWFILVLIIQLISFVLGLVFPALVAHVFDNLGLSLTYFSTPLLVIGLYVCPSLIGLSLPITMYYSIQCNHVRKTFYEYDGSLSRDESGYLFNFQDRLEEKPLLDTNVDLTGLVNIKTECEKHMMCGMPLYDYRFVENRLQSKWLPRAEPIVPPGVTTLEVLRKTILNSTTVQFEFHLMGPAQMSLFIEPYEDVTIMDWSFLRSYLEKPPPYPLSYHIFFNYGIDSSPLKFFIQISKANGDFNVPLMQLGVSGHFVGDKGDEQSMKFASSYPSFSIVASWPSSYQRYIF